MSAMAVAAPRRCGACGAACVGPRRSHRGVPACSARCETRMRRGRMVPRQAHDDFGLDPAPPGFAPDAYAVVFDRDTPDGPLPVLYREYGTRAEAEGAAEALAASGRACRVERWTDRGRSGGVMRQRVVAEYEPAITGRAEMVV